MTVTIIILQSFTRTKLNIRTRAAAIIATLFIAISNYSASAIILGDPDRSCEPLELSVVLANRSAALYHLERYEHALEDIEEASRLGYPKDLFYKLEERRARCLLGLRRHDEAVEAFRRSLGALDDANVSLERKQRLEADIRVMLAMMDKGKQLNEAAKPKNALRTDGRQRPGAQKNEEKTHSLFIPEKKRNPSYPACSKAVEIRDDGGDVGRHAVATREVSPGEIVIVERPHCASLLAENRSLRFTFTFLSMYVGNKRNNNAKRTTYDSPG